MLAILFSCNGNLETNKKRLQKNKEVIIEKNIYGNWTISSVLNNELTSFCNQCPVINFKRNGTASIKNQPLELIFWHIKNDVLIISHRSKYDIKTIKDFHYELKYKKESLINDIQLVNSKEKISYNLVR